METKVVAASTSAAVSTFVIAWLSTEVFRGALVPAVLVGLINGAVAAAAAFVAGWLAQHTPRTADVAQLPAAPPSPGPTG